METFFMLLAAISCQRHSVFRLYMCPCVHAC